MPSDFFRRHIGVTPGEAADMLTAIGLDSLDQLIDQTVPADIRHDQDLLMPQAMEEAEYLAHVQQLAGRNQCFDNYIGQGYYGTLTPSVLLRNIFENPGWYTQYTPYQAEISQGRLEALFNFQTVVSDLCGLPITNASLLDEGTAAAEAMAMFFGHKNKRNKGTSINRFLVSAQVFPQTLAVLETRARPLGIELIVAEPNAFVLDETVFGILLQYPDARGQVRDYRSLCATAAEHDIRVTVAADLLSLCLLEAPGEWGADAVVGNTQRFGVPMGYGGPHAAYFATRDNYKRLIPGRIIGLSEDQAGRPALRMALQTREQHIRREKATSNICTAQALLAVMAGMYAVWHGPEGLQQIATRIHDQARRVDQQLRALGYDQRNTHYFDTLRVQADADYLHRLRLEAEAHQINLYYDDQGFQLSIDESTTDQQLDKLLGLLQQMAPAREVTNAPIAAELPQDLRRQTPYLQHPVFSNYQTETEMMRYLKRLENRDLSLVHSMIPLGSCTMKLNAAIELLPVSWPAFAGLHPFVPVEQAAGYQQLFTELETALQEITGFAACSLQPNSGAQGEYAGLMTIRAYHLDRGDDQRVVALIPESAHGTNPASAVMAGMEVVVVPCDERGNIKVGELKAAAAEHRDRLAALLVTYPSTHGVFEADIREICAVIHENGGLVYMDGANMNAQVGLTSPATIGADICHLNLHKTFAIPHGGGGPGMGPICANEKLAPYLPGHPLVTTGGEKAISAVSAAPWGSASILLISYAYIKLLGPDGLKAASIYAILNANYIQVRLQQAYDVLYTGEQGRSAHELIIDLRPFKAQVSAEDVAKRLIDYGFHAPTLSFPVAGTIMIEPTESENKAELDRFCDAMLAIRQEIDDIASGKSDPKDNPLVNAPHTLQDVTADEWSHPYARQVAAWPLPYTLERGKSWPAVSRVLGAQGDRNLICTCPPVEAYQ